jgi:hypothetical protein
MPVFFRVIPGDGVVSDGGRAGETLFVIPSAQNGRFAASSLVLVVNGKVLVKNF